VATVVIQVKEAEMAKFGDMTAELTQHIGELETSETRNVQLLESNAAERLRLRDELNVAVRREGPIERLFACGECLYSASSTLSASELWCC
jgi:hypothetical protein